MPPAGGDQPAPLPNAVTSTSAILDAAVALAERGGRAMLCAIVRSRGSTPQAAGSLMLVDDRAEMLGTVGGGCVEADVRRQAFELLAAGGSSLLRFRLDGDYGWDDGLVCGGTVEIAVAPLPALDLLRSLRTDLEEGRSAMLTLDVLAGDRVRRFAIDLPRRERLLIAGAGHVGQAVARLALSLGDDVTIFDDRADCLDRFSPPGTARVAGDIAENLRRTPVDERTSAVVVTRGHRHDEQALAALLDRGARYLGMIGSRRKVALTFKDLRERGVAESSLAAVHAPIGLPIGAVTVQEIAISIAAQLVQVRRATGRPAVRELTCDGRPADVDDSAACGVHP